MAAAQVGPHGGPQAAMHEQGPQGLFQEQRVRGDMRGGGDEDGLRAPAHICEEATARRADVPDLRGAGGEEGHRRGSARRRQ